MIIDKLKLPSNGLLGVASEIGVKAMTGAQLTKVYSSLSDESIDSIIREVTVPSLDPKELCDEDKTAILYFTRLLTFGDTMIHYFKCPVCESVHRYEISYNDLSVTYLKEASHTIELSNGDKLHIRIPTQAIHQSIELFRDKHKVSPFDSYILYIMSRVSKVEKNDGSNISSQFELFNYLKDLPGNVFGEIPDIIDIKFGLNTTAKVECPKTHADFMGVLGINADFFRNNNRAV